MTVARRRAIPGRWRCSRGAVSRGADGMAAKKVTTRKKVGKARTITSKSTARISSRKTKTAGKAAKPRASPKPISLGRPQLPGDSDLDLVFKDDFEARQCFAFLRVRKLWELEQLAPQDIVARLTQPVTSTIDRIRRKLADYNRFLSGDEDFAKTAKAEASAS